MKRKICLDVAHAYQGGRIYNFARWGEKSD